jgi:outer membrane protein, heavy metal efflux system
VQLIIDPKEHLLMSFKATRTYLLIGLGFAFSQSLLSETIMLERSDSIALNTLTNKVYQQHPAFNYDLSLQQQINANTDFANAYFADVSNVNVRHQNDVIGSSDGLQEWEAMVEMSLWLPGQKQQQLSLSEKMMAEVPAYKQKTRLEASAIVRELIWNIELAETATKQAYQTWQNAKKLEQDVNARVKAGELASAEHLLVSNNVLELQSDYLLVQADLEHAVSSYKHITGETVLPNNVEETLAETLKQDHSSVVVNQQHPYLTVLDQQINTLRTHQQLAQFDGAINPNLSLGVRSEKAEHGESFNNSIGIGISFALDNKVYRQPAIAAASKALADTEIARQKLERKLNITLFTALHDLETKQQQLTLLAEQDITTQKYLLSQERAFDLGEIDLVNLLRSQSLAQEVQNSKQTLSVNVKQMIAKVNQALGIVL